MGCTPFREHWDRSADDLLVDAAEQCFASTPAIKKEDVDAYWLGTMASGQSGMTLSRPLSLDYKPVTRLENLCATGSEAMRNACYAVASGAYDRVMAIGVEKLKDSGFSGLVRQNPDGDGTDPGISMTAPAAFSLLDPAYCKKYGVDRRRHARCDDAHRLEEPPQRRAEPARAVPEGGRRRRRSRARRSWPGGSACSTARASPTAPRVR